MGRLPLSDFFIVSASGVGRRATGTLGLLGFEIVYGTADPDANSCADGVTYISSSGIVARLLTDLRRLGNRETPAVLSMLVLEDFATLISIGTK